MLALLLVVLAALVGGATAGAYFTWNYVQRDLRQVARVARDATGRANAATAQFDTIVATWPLERLEEIADHVERLHVTVMRWQTERDQLERRATETAALVRALELELAGSFGITTRKD